MINRAISNEILNLSRQYPVITIIGPRQAGKTTIAKATFKSYNYVNLELPEIRNLAREDANAFFNTYECPLIIDEIQRVPELLSYIQVKVDSVKQNGLFILTGSNQLQLNESISQSLAGRTAIVKLLPLSIDELDQAAYDKAEMNTYPKDSYPEFTIKIRNHSGPMVTTSKHILNETLDNKLM